MILGRFNKDKSKYEAIRLSNDHKFSEEEVKRIEQCNGKLIERNGHQKIIPGDMLEKDIIKQKLALNMSRSFGHPTLSKYGISPEPDFTTIDLSKDDILVVASDGLFEILVSFAN